MKRFIEYSSRARVELMRAEPELAREALRSFNTPSFEEWKKGRTQTCMGLCVRAREEL